MKAAVRCDGSRIGCLAEDVSIHNVMAAATATVLYTET